MKRRSALLGSIMPSGHPEPLASAGIRVGVTALPGSKTHLGRGDVRLVVDNGGVRSVREPGEGFADRGLAALCSRGSAGAGENNFGNAGDCVGADDDNRRRAGRRADWISSNVLDRDGGGHAVHLDSLARDISRRVGAFDPDGRPLGKVGQRDRGRGAGPGEVGVAKKWGRKAELKICPSIQHGRAGKSFEFLNPAAGVVHDDGQSILPRKSPVRDGVAPNTPLRRAAACAIAALLLICSSCSAFAFEFSREERLKHADDSIARVRQNLNNPDIVEYELLSMAQMIGDDPRILPLCKEVAEKASNPGSIGMALGATKELFGRAAVSPKKAAEVYRIGAKRGDLRDRVTAARFLSELGGKYRKEGHALFLSLLHEKADPKVIFNAMAESFGADPEVLDHFGQIVAISTDTEAVNEALNSLRTIVNRDVKDRHDEKTASAIASIYRRAMKNKSVAVELNAAYYLSEMGPKYAVEARQFYEERLRKPFGTGPDAEAAKWASIRILRPMVEEDRPEDYALLRDAAKTNDLLDYFDKNFVATEGAATFNHKIAERWKALVREDHATH